MGFKGKVIKLMELQNSRYHGKMNRPLSEYQNVMSENLVSFPVLLSYLTPLFVSCGELMHFHASLIIGMGDYRIYSHIS